LADEESGNWIRAAPGGRILTPVSDPVERALVELLLQGSELPTQYKGRVWRTKTIYLEASVNNTSDI
jgi:hypothetical protein